MASSSVGYYFPTDATFDAADQLLTSQFRGQLTPNFPSSRFDTAAVPPGVAPGAYFILFAADYQNQVGETDENNNVRAVSFTVSPPGVDLVITQEQLFPLSAVADNFLRVNCLIVNQGNVQANTSTAGFYLSTNQVLDVADVLLSTTQGGIVTAPGFEAVVSCTVSPQPDLLLTQIGASPSSMPAGGSLSLSTIVANQGFGLRQQLGSGLLHISRPTARRQRPQSGHKCRRRARS